MATPARPSVVAVVLLVACFATAIGELLPTAVLGSIGGDLRLGAAELGVSVGLTGLAALLTAPLTTTLLPRIDRRTLLVAFALTGAGGNLLIASAAGLPSLVIGRVAIGVAVGGFWALALAVVARIVPHGAVGRTMMIVNLGISATLTIGLPLAVIVDDTWGWRTVTLAAAVMGVVAAALLTRLPSLPGRVGIRRHEHRLLGALAIPGLAVGLVAVVMIVASHLGTYVFIRTVLDDLLVDTAAQAGLLVAFGASAGAGNLLVGAIVDRRLASSGVAIGVAMTVGLAGLFLAGEPEWLTMTSFVVWGAGYGGFIVVLQTWIARIGGARVEAATALHVIALQSAAMLGTSAFGVATEWWGARNSEGLATMVLALGAIVFAVVVGVAARSSTSRDRASA